jgi:sporulation protein YlmC with PRC-barrel domain
MKHITSIGGAALMAGAALFTQMPVASAELMTNVPSSGMTVTDWYKQDVYDHSNAKIGKIEDVLISSSGQINAVIVAVGGFLGAGEKDVAVDFSSVKRTMKDNKAYLTMDTSKDAIKSAPGFKYDSDKTRWVPISSK